MVYSFKLSLAVFITIMTSLVIFPLGLFDRRGKVAYEISRCWAWGILKISGIRLNVQGVERLDSSRQYIFMANHQSLLDIPILVQSLLEFQLRWIAKKELFYIPVFGWALWSSRHITVDRSSRTKASASFKKALERIKGGSSVVLFPEGTRGLGGGIMPFKRGGFVLAARTKTPIVPVTINGSGAILSKGNWRIRGGNVEVIVNDPIPLEQQRPGNLRSLSTYVQGVMESRFRKQVGPFGDGSNQAQALVSAEPLVQG
ncbi:MAG: lysophospholipid acyltransferase family protein [Candidatus Binatia bacterium]